MSRKPGRRQRPHLINVTDLAGTGVNFARLLAHSNDATWSTLLVQLPTITLTYSLINPNDDPSTIIQPSTINYEPSTMNNNSLAYINP